LRFAPSSTLAMRFSSFVRSRTSDARYAEDPVMPSRPRS
jgi:hypothetical protein